MLHGYVQYDQHNYYNEENDWWYCYNAEGYRYQHKIKIVVNRVVTYEHCDSMEHYQELLHQYGLISNYLSDINIDALNMILK